LAIRQETILKEKASKGFTHELNQRFCLFFLLDLTLAARFMLIHSKQKARIST